MKTARLMLAAAVAFGALTALPAQAEKIKFYEDPLYQPLNKDDPHPMSDLIALAEQNDVRAQFILADLYAKGKGGLAKDTKKAQKWFEASARQGYAPSFLRLAALAKRADDPVSAYQWYTLAGEVGRGGDQKFARTAREQLAADARMSKEDIKEAATRASDWKRERIKEDEARAEAEKVKQRREALKAEEERKAAEAAARAEKIEAEKAARAAEQQAREEEKRAKAEAKAKAAQEREDAEKKAEKEKAQAKQAARDKSAKDEKDEEDEAKTPVFKQKYESRNQKENSVNE